MAQIHEAIAAMMRECPAIEKDRKNTSQGYNFRGVDDVYAAIHPLLVKHGVFSVPNVIEDRHEERTNAKGTALIYRVLKIRYDFFAADGSTISATVVGEGMDSGDKASNKAMSVAHKYALLQLLAIPTADTKDPEDDSHEIRPKIVHKEIESKISDGDRELGDLIKAMLNDLDPEGRKGLRAQMLKQYGRDFSMIARKLEEMQLMASQSTSAAAVSKVFDGEIVF